MDGSGRQHRYWQHRFIVVIHRIPLNRVHAIVEFEEWVAIVLHSSIIFLSKRSSKVNVNVRMEKPSLFDRVCDYFRR